MKYAFAIAAGVATGILRFGAALANAATRCLKEGLAGAEASRPGWNKARARSRWVLASRYSPANQHVIPATRCATQVSPLRRGGRPRREPASRVTRLARNCPPTKP